MDSENIILGGRSHITYTVLATQISLYSSYYSAFSTTLKTKLTTRLHQDQMPLPLKTYREMLRHPFKDDLQRACDQEINTLKSKNTFNLVLQLDNDYNNSSLPLMWV